MGCLPLRLYLQPERTFRTDREVIVGRLAVDHVLAFPSERMLVYGLCPGTCTLFFDRVKQADIPYAFFSQLLGRRYLSGDDPLRVTSSASIRIFSSSSVGAMYGGTVSMWVDSQTRGGVVQRPDDVALSPANRLQLDRPSKRFQMVARPKSNRFLFAGNGRNIH